MARRKILTYPHPMLRKQAAKVTRFDGELRRLVEDMAETMYAAPGIGLAATQIGVLEQVVLVDVSEQEGEQRYQVLVNPVLSEGEGEVVSEEGCLSVLDFTAKVARFRKIHVTAQDLDGKVIEFDAVDREARIIQHEVDHLHGTLFIDRISTLKRTLYKKKLKKLLKKRKQER